MTNARILFAAVAGLALAASAPPPPGTLLTPDGLGPVRIGMSRDEVVRVLGSPLEGEELTEGCIEMQPASGYNGVTYMFEEGRLTRISIGLDSGIAAPRGIRAGATEADVMRAYGSAVEREQHTYQEPPAAYLTVWSETEGRGLQFETDEARRVDTVHAGGASIRYVEGCL